MLHTPPSDPRAAPTAELFARYLEIIEDAGDFDHLASHPRLSLANLAWMCRQGRERVHDLPIDKTSRWLGFVQGCLAMRGLIDVDEERDISRPMLHPAYEALGHRPPERLERG